MLDSWALKRNASFIFLFVLVSESLFATAIFYQVDHEFPVATNFIEDVPQDFQRITRGPFEMVVCENEGICARLCAITPCDSLATYASFRASVKKGDPLPESLRKHVRPLLDLYLASVVSDLVMQFL